MNQESSSENQSLAAVARWIIIIVGGLFLLRELGVILKPLLLAVMAGYVIIPIYAQVKKYAPGKFAIFAMAGLTILLFYVVTAVIESNVSTLRDEMPSLRLKAKQMNADARELLLEKYPGLVKQIDQLTQEEMSWDSLFRDYATSTLNVMANTLGTMLVVGLYLLFLLMEFSRFGKKINAAFSTERADTIMQTISGINRGISQYIIAKVKASLLMAMPVFILLSLFGVRFAFFWAVLTFVCNFIPYLGSVIAFSVPAAFALLQLGPHWEIVVIGIVLLAIHISTASVIEPAIIGKAVGVSPVVILFALAFWGYTWGFTGMILAVPLTVIAKIIMSYIPSTMPIAKIISEE